MRFHRLDLNLLVALDALLDERNVTRAAARLGYTQPTISGMLARLRDLFGDPSSYAHSAACWQLRVHKRWPFR